MVGLKANDESPRRRPGTDAAHVAAVSRRIAELKARINEGGAREAAIRALLYVRLAEGAADERGLAFLRRVRAEHGGGLTLVEFKQLVRDQFLMLLLDEDRAVDAIPAMLSTDRERVARMRRDFRGLIEAVGLKTDLGKARLAEIEAMFAAIGSAPASDIDRLGEAVSAGLPAGSSRRIRNSKKTAA